MGKIFPKICETMNDLVLPQLPLLLQNSSNLWVNSTFQSNCISQATNHNQSFKSTLHVWMIEQIVESLIVAHKDGVQVESPQPEHSPDLVLLVQLPKSSHWVTLELFHPDQLEEVAKLKFSISINRCLISKSYQRQTNAWVWQKKPFPAEAKLSKIYCKHCISKEMCIKIFLVT